MQGRPLQRLGMIVSPRARACLLLLLALAPAAGAQPLDTLRPLRPMFGVPDSLFFIGAWSGVLDPSVFDITSSDLANRVMTIRGATDPAAQNDRVWLWARAMGVNVLRRQMDWAGFPDSALDISALRDTNTQRLILSGSDIIDWAGNGTQAHFFFTDSVRYREEPSAFGWRGGGSDVMSPIEDDDRGDKAREQMYDSTNATPGQLIAERPTFNWQPWQTHRWQWYEDGSWKQRADTTIQNSDFFFHRPHQNNEELYHVNLKGHLFQGGTAANSAAVLRVEIWYERPRGSTIMIDSAGVPVPRLWTVNDSALIDSFSVTKSAFLPTANPSDPNRWSYYRDFDATFHPRVCLNGETGPTYPGNTSQSFNIKVFWTGAEKLALNSLVIRDSVGDLIMTDNVAFRAAVRARAEQMLYRADSSRRLRSVIALSLAGEEPSIQAAPVTRVYRWLREWMNERTDSARFHPAPSTEPWYGADSLPGWIEGGNPESQHRLYDLDVVSVEGGIKMQAWWQDLFQSPHYSIPTLALHNGGRFTGALDPSGTLSRPLELLDVETPATRLANVENYELMLQRIAFGHYVPVGGEAPFRGALYDMSQAAQVARDFRRRNIFIFFNVAPMGFDIRDSIGSGGVVIPVLDTIVRHLPEAGEQRALLNTALAYGSKGIHYQVLEAQMNFLSAPDSTRNNLRKGILLDWGSNGPLTSDTSQDRVASIRFKELDPVGWYGNTDGYDIRDIYLGWGNRSRETKRYNQWLRDSIGPLLMKLNWRDAYSIYYTVEQPYRIKKYRYRGDNDPATSVYYRAVGHRPLPSTEIVTAVRSWRRDWVGSGANRHDTLIADSLTRTYVELGLFHRQNSTGEPRFDTNWIMVVNRRALERPSDVHPDSALGRILDTLAEVRTITLKLNLLNFDQFNFVRVREVGADVTPLPLSSSARVPLDSILHADSTIRLVLSPGRAALLEITYMLPDTNVVAGRVAVANQRKLLWDPYQRRYHSVYMMATDTSRLDEVRYRRSVPMSDSAGTILWELDTITWADGYKGYPLSRTNDPLDSIVANRHPSLTMRRTPAGSTFPAGTMITVVWTAHRVPITYPARQVLLRTIWSPDGTDYALMDRAVDVVDSAVHGLPQYEWGTPVISRTEGSDIIAWSDSIVGIKAVARVVNNPLLSYDWWRSPAVYTDTIHVSARQTNDYGLPGKYPSVPTFAHIRSLDSNIAVVWEQATAGPVNNPARSDIYFKRLLHTTVTGVDTLEALDSSLAIVNVRAGRHRHPSMTLHQNFWKEVQDVVAWEEKQSLSFGANVWTSLRIHERSIFSETRSPSLNPPDVIIAKPQLWGYGAVIVPAAADEWAYPNICSIVPPDSLGGNNSRASIAHNLTWKGVADLMGEVSMPWASMNMKSWRRYTYGGRALSNSESPDSQPTHHAVLYEESADSGRRLRTTREFFLGRARPTGYMADGRELSMRMNDSSGAGHSLMMLDAWYANTAMAAALPLVARDTSSRTIAKLSDATSLLRTSSFSSFDSTAVGVTINATFDGDTTGYWASRVGYVVELIDTVGTRVHLLDSFEISTTNRGHSAVLADTIDLLSGAYRLRVLVDTTGVPVPARSNDSRYPIGELAMYVDDSSSLGKMRLMTPVRSEALRVSVQPNPASESAEARFSVAEAGRVSVVLSDYVGEYTATLIDEWLEPGRYAVSIDLAGLVAGVYVVHVRAPHATGSEKIRVTR